MVLNKEGGFDVGSGPTFMSLYDLVEHYKQNPMVETSGTVIKLKHPFYATSLLPANLVKELSEWPVANGFLEEFQVSVCALRSSSMHQWVFAATPAAQASLQQGGGTENKLKNRCNATCENSLMPMWGLHLNERVYEIMLTIFHFFPVDHTRVVLKNVDPAWGLTTSMPTTSIPGFEQTYIAAQRCLPGTVTDFWKMVWQERSMVIVKATNYLSWQWLHYTAACCSVTFYSGR